MQNCNVYNDLAWNILYDRESKIQHDLRLEHGNPLVFGPADDRRGIVLDGVKPRVVKVKDTQESALWVHDETDPGAALVLAQLSSPEFPIATGVLLRAEEPVYEEILVEQERKAISDHGRGEIEKLLLSGETWKVA